MNTIHRTGAISIATAITVAGGLIVGAASSVIWVFGQINQAVAPVQAETTQNSKDIAVIQSKLDDLQWIKAALEANGIKPAQSFFTQPK
jgi:hypothetical protein